MNLTDVSQFVSNRSTLYKAISGELLDLDCFLSVRDLQRVHPVSAPTTCTMGITSEVPLADSALGLVEAGSPLSYQ